MAAALILEISGVDGECQLDGYENKITLLSFNHGMSQPMTMDPTNQARTVGRMNCQDLSVTKALDASSVSLINGMCTSKNFGTTKLYLLKSVGDTSLGQKLALTIQLDEMMISSYSLGGGGGGEPVETLTLNATKFTWTYQPQQSTGAVSGNDTTNWNVKTGKKD